MPNVKNMRKWVKALRSGEYSQTHGKLKDDSGFCCLGVACDVSGVAAWKEGIFGIYYDESSLSLPSKVQSWLGININDPQLIGVRKQSATATDLNDEKNYTFKQIANAIERRWPEVKEKRTK